MADYLGGDWRGVIEKLDYLEDLGVNTLWLTSPQSNPEGIYDGKCDMDIAQEYHGYYQNIQRKWKNYFGDKSALLELVDKAHKRNIRVLFDWVGNHVFETHPYAEEHPEWFTDYHLCDENDNWNQAPETCWFALYSNDFLLQSPNQLDRWLKMLLYLPKSMIWMDIVLMPSNTSPMQYIENSKRRSPRELKMRTLISIQLANFFQEMLDCWNSILVKPYLMVSLILIHTGTFWEPLEGMKSRCMKWKMPIKEML